MIIIFIPFSDELNITMGQGEEAKRFALARGFVLDSVVFADSVFANDFLERLRQGDRLIIPELVSLGNSMLAIVRAMKAILDRGAYLYTADGQYSFDETMDIPSTMKMIEMVADIDSRVISRRTRTALHKRRSLGVKLGRPEGTRSKFEIIAANMDYINEAKANGESAVGICRNIGVSYTTYRRYFSNRG